MRWLKISGLIAFSIGLIVLIVFVRKADRETILKKPEILIQVEGESAFLTKSELLLRLERGGLCQKDYQLKNLTRKKWNPSLKKCLRLRVLKCIKTSVRSGKLTWYCAYQ